MNETLAAFITRRNIELDDEELPLKQRLDAVRAERDQLRRAALAAGIEAQPDSGQEAPKRGRRPREGTIKTTVVAILQEVGRPMTALELLEQVNNRQGTTLMRSSLSPQLSRLKEEGAIKLTDKLWHLPEQSVSENEEPDPSLFAEDGSGTSITVPEAQGVKAAPGGGG